MSPSQYHEDPHVRREINGPRPSPLKINKDSQLIQKTSSSSSSCSTSSLLTTAAATVTKQRRHPVIIYTHSPKIIHTQARDFMALVQKLTGHAPSDESSLPLQQRHVPEGGNPPPPEGNNETATSSVIMDDKCDIKVSSSSVSPVFDPPNLFFSEIPLFTPNASDFFCSPRPFYRYPDPVLSSQYGELDLAFHP